MSYSGISKEHVCPCGKTFLVPYQSKGGGRTRWVYQRRIKRKAIYYCSYCCFNRFKAEA